MKLKWLSLILTGVGTVLGFVSTSVNNKIADKKMHDTVAKLVDQKINEKK